VDEALRLTPSESITIRSRSEELLEVEARYGPHGKPPPKHWHPAQDERFEVAEGQVRVRTPTHDKLLDAGDEIEIPRKTVHQIWNPADHPARVIWQTRPAGRTEDWFRALDRLNRSEGGEQRRPGTLAFAVLLDEYDDVFRLAVGPSFLSRAASAVLAPIGRLRGHTAS
jgi:mannose-6-phosphate isomerase-like protein (cupin superfamily)